MPDDQRPAVLAYDGSPSADAAIRATVPLLAGRPLLIATAWESTGAAFAMSPLDSSMPGVANAPVDPAMISELQHAGEQHAAHVAGNGVRLAIELGGAAEPIVLDSPTDAASALVEFAEARDAAFVVVGSRGHRGLRRRVLGSTSQKLLHHCSRPVLVV